MKQHDGFSFRVSRPAPSRGPATRLPATLVGVLMATLMAALACAAPAGADPTAKPPVPRLAPQPSQEPLIAILGAGVDYTRADITASLARDGEGDIIGRDVVDQDLAPFDRSRGTLPADVGGEMTLAAAMLAGPPRLVPVRFEPRDPRSLAQAILHVSRTPARTVLLLGIEGHPLGTAVLAEAAMRFPDMLFVLPWSRPLMGLKRLHEISRSANVVIAGTPGDAGFHMIDAPMGPLCLTVPSDAQTPRVPLVAAAAAVANGPAVFAKKKGAALPPADKAVPGAALRITFPGLRRAGCYPGLSGS